MISEYQVMPITGETYSGTPLVEQPLGLQRLVRVTAAGSLTCIKASGNIVVPVTTAPADFIISAEFTGVTCDVAVIMS